MESVESKTTKCLCLEEGGKELIMKEFSLPTLKQGEVLIKVEFVPIHNSDIANPDSKGKAEGYQFFGYEGSGVVVENGGGFSGWRLKNKKVAFYTREPGAWAEYVVVPTEQVIKLDEKITLENGSCALINPLTAFGILEIIKEENHKAVIISAGASSLGKMLLRICKEEKIRTIAVVSSQEQRNICAESGADVVLISGDDTFDEQIKQQSLALNATCFIDLVGGKLASKVFLKMPKQSTLYLVGNLSREKSVEFDVDDMRISNKAIREFNGRNWMDKLNILKRTNLFSKVSSSLDTSMKTVYSKTFNVSQINEAMETASKNRTAGKILLRFGPDVY
jgi:NADPH2:quinone reductase